jgi:hypothetical protein
LHRHGDDAYAKRMIQRALELNEDPDRLDPMLELLGDLEIVEAETPK